MAATAISLHLRPNRHRFIQNPNFFHQFSSSSSSSDHPNPDDETSPPSQSQSQQPGQQSSFASYFSDVKASLKQSPSSFPQRRHQQQQPNFSSSIEEIRKNLSEFRRRSNVPPPPSNTPTLSFQELYKRNVLPKGDVGGGGSSNDVTAKTGHLSIDAIRESLKLMKRTPVQRQPQGPPKKMAFEKFGEGLKLQPPNLNMGGTMPDAVAKVKESDESSDAMKMEFVKTYSYGELGEKLKMLRPNDAKGKKSWFSLEELNDRLRKLRELEDKEPESRIGSITFKDLREILVQLKISDDDNKNKNAIQRLNVLGQLGGTPSFMLSPPKEELVEKYFHSDHMSSAEKLNLELKKVRDEFKMSESDCGSARVQVAQLTTKIKHLSTALHKKDKHSRKGLQGMVQQRKKLLKYLRRTDWDSYCLVLSKLGLRDNPDYKH